MVGPIVALLDVRPEFVGRDSVASAHFKEVILSTFGSGMETHECISSEVGIKRRRAPRLHSIRITHSGPRESR
jgi:hypothetical protein